MLQEEIKPLQYTQVNDIPWMSQSHVHVGNPESVIKKLNAIIKGGKDKLQVIFDFDRTLSKHHHNGVVTDSTFGVLERFPKAPEGFEEKSRASLMKYRPIEVDPTMTIEEKLPYMLEWWTEGIGMLKGIEWDPVFVDEYLSKNQQPLRDGTDKCFKDLCNAGIPTLVFSAGLGDVVKSFLSHAGLLTSNVHIVSNFFKIVDGKIVDYENDVIHVFNKNETQIKNTPFYNELTGRTNVILLGDSIGDTSMADGVPHDTVLKIGFLNTNIEESLSLYKELFDIVLADDQTMGVLQNILNKIL